MLKGAGHRERKDAGVISIEADVGADCMTRLHRRLPLPMEESIRCGAALCGWLGGGGA